MISSKQVKKMMSDKFLKLLHIFYSVQSLFENYTSSKSGNESSVLTTASILKNAACNVIMRNDAPSEKKKIDYYFFI